MICICIELLYVYFLLLSSSIVYSVNMRWKVKWYTVSSNKYSKYGNLFVNFSVDAVTMKSDPFRIQLFGYEFQMRSSTLQFLFRQKKKTKWNENNFFRIWMLLKRLSLWVAKYLHFLNVVTYLIWLVVKFIIVQFDSAFINTFQKCIQSLFELNVLSLREWWWFQHFSVLFYFRD